MTPVGLWQPRSRRARREAWRLLVVCFAVVPYARLTGGNHDHRRMAVKQAEMLADGCAWALRWRALGRFGPLITDAHAAAERVGGRWQAGQAAEASADQLASDYHDLVAAATALRDTLGGGPVDPAGALVSSWRPTPRRGSGVGKRLRVALEDDVLVYGHPGADEWVTRWVKDLWERLVADLWDAACGTVTELAMDALAHCTAVLGRYEPAQPDEAATLTDPGQDDDYRRLLAAVSEMRTVLASTHPDVLPADRQQRRAEFADRGASWVTHGLLAPRLYWPTSPWDLTPAGAGAQLRVVADRLERVLEVAASRVPDGPLVTTHAAQVRGLAATARQVAVTLAGQHDPVASDAQADSLAEALGPFVRSATGVRDALAAAYGFGAGWDRAPMRADIWWRAGPS